MKRFLIFSLSLLTYMSAAAGSRVTRIDPTDWYVGMNDASLQLMVYGSDIRDADVTTDYPGVVVDSIVRLDSPNYLLVYLNLKDVKAGAMTLKFKFNSGKGKRSLDVKYALKERDMAGDKRVGFTNADVLYMLMPDRFANGDEKNDNVSGMNAYVTDRSQPSLRHGGDLEGIRRHLDYFKELGATALWLTPVLENNSPDNNGFSTYHGYATTDYYRVDPRFGCNDEYRRLVDEAHANGLKVVMDMIFNHCGFEHPWVKDMPTKDWFNTPEWLSSGEGSGNDASTGHAVGEKNELYLQTSYKLTPVLDPYASEIDLHETVDGWFVPSMPDLNQRNPHVMKYLVQNSIWWIETVGIDGIRMDTYPYADRKAMARWMKTLDDEYPNFNTVGETWVTEPAYTASWQKNSKASDVNSYLKTVMDFSFYDKMNQAKREQTDGWWNGYNRIYNSLVYDYLYPNPKSVMAFIDNHDTDRFLGDTDEANIDGKVAVLKQALALLLTMNRIPQLYYGTEVLMDGTKSVTDGNVRKDFPGGFSGDKANAFTASGRTARQNDMFNWLSRLLHWRQGSDVIVKGRQTQFIPFNGVYVVARTYGGKAVLTILNGTDREASMPVSRYAEVIGSAKSALDITTGEQVSLSSADVKLAPRQAMILEYEMAGE